MSPVRIRAWFVCQGPGCPHVPLAGDAWAAADIAAESHTRTTGHVTVLHVEYRPAGDPS